MKNLLTFLMATLSVAVNAQQHVDFSLTDVMNGQTVSTETYPSCEGIVVIFTSNACPYDGYYRQRVATLAESYRDKVPVLLVNSLPDGAESVAQMKIHGTETALSVPYLADKEQTLMAKLGARKTPEAFLLKNDNGKFTVVYRGAIDDNPQVAADVRHHYLRDAIDIMRNGQKIETPEVRPVGCNLKKK